MDEAFGYQKLQVWTRSMSLAEEVYQISNEMNAEEKFGMQSQIRRAAISIPANIAEGFGRNGSKAFAQYVRVSLGSSYELATLLELAQRLNLADILKLEKVRKELMEIARMLHSFHKHLVERDGAVHELIASYGEPDSTLLPTTTY